MSTPTVALRVDAHPATGVGHAIRSLALAQELRSRQVPVTVHGEFTVDWVRAAYEAAGLIIEPSESLFAAGRSHAVLDGYDLDPALGARLRERGTRVLAVVDGRFGAEQVADVYLDQNFGAVPHHGGPSDSIALTGPRYALLRDDVLAARDARRAAPISDAATDAAVAPHVLAVFGGTDPFDAAGTLTPLLLATGAPARLTVVSPRGQIGDEGQVRPRPDQQVRVVGTLRDLPAVAASVDLVVTAAGSTVWELLTIGVPTAVVAVVDNQVAGYETTTAAGLVAGAGHLPLLQDPEVGGAEREQVTRTLRRLLTDPEARQRLAATATAAFDGAGRARVADVLLGPG